jgi:excisionase family DNA binding protein
MDRKWLERVAALLGVEPYEIDAYIQARAPDLMRADDKVLHFLRSRLSGRDEPLHRPADKTPRQHRRVPDEALWVSPSQAARILNVARSTLYEMMDEGQIRWSRLKGRRGRRIEMAEIRRVMESA